MADLIDRQANMLEVVCSFADIDRIVDAKQRRLEDIEQNWETITRHMDCGELRAYQQHCCDEEIIIDVLKNAMRFLAVDAVEVVRCKDCDKSRPSNMMGCGWRFCMNNSQHHKDEHFCSYGERRGEDAAD